MTLLLVVLETARRGVGWPLTLVAALALLYGLFGQYIPGEFGHSGTPVESFFGTLTIAEGGIWGTLTGASVSVVAIFVIFGAVLNLGEAGQGFMNVAALGRSTGRSLGDRARGLGSDVTLVRSDRSAPTHTDDRALCGRADSCILRPMVLTNLV